MAGLVRPSTSVFPLAIQDADARDTPFFERLRADMTIQLSLVTLYCVNRSARARKTCDAAAANAHSAGIATIEPRIAEISGWPYLSKK